MSLRKPVIGITMGDAAGIGPEIALKSLADHGVRTSAECVIIGDAMSLRETARFHGYSDNFAEFGDPDAPPGAIKIYDIRNLSAGFDFGCDQSVTGKASAEYIEAAVNLWREGKIDAVCTAPISKKALALGGYDFPGHTEFLAALTDTNEFAMSFFGGDLRVVLLSTHLPLSDAIDLVKADRITKLISFMDREMGKLLDKKISIAVAGLNPHASEGGMFGSEEAAEVIPAIDHCREALGINVSGPYSPDTIFMRGFRGEFDAVIALYHDQATIAVKSLAFGSAVNVTLGLPLIRTSVDHGTAYDIAGKGIADASSMAAAIKLGAELVSRSRITGEI